MDCCNYGDYRAAPHAWAGADYECAARHGYPAPRYYGSPYAGYAPHASYAPDYAPHDYHAHRYADYTSPLHHQLDRERSLIEYGGAAGYACREGRARRGAARRELERARARTPAHRLQLAHASTPPLDCGMTGRAAPAAYCEPQQLSWSHYQMGGSGWGGGWGTRGVPAHRDPLRHLAAMHDHCTLRNSKMNNASMDQMGSHDARSAAYSPYEDPGHGARVTEPSRPRSLAPEFVDYTAARPRAEPERPRHEPAPAPVPLPAFQQAFGSTEIGRFAEAFSRAEAAHDAAQVAETHEMFPEWEPPEAAWLSQQARTLKCENY